MNKENYILAKRKYKRCDDVQIINAAVWIEDATVSYINTANFDSILLGILEIIKWRTC
jgi:hypothetical protein